MEQRSEQAHLEERHGELGPWTVEPCGLPPGAPPRCWIGSRAMALFYPSGRLRAEQRGLVSCAGHAARPRVIASDDHALVFHPFGAPVADPLAAVLAGGPVRRVRRFGTRRDLLDSLGSEVKLSRALGRIGARRRHVDRWLNEEVSIETAIGPVLGGLRAGWWREQAGRAVALRWDRAQAEGWLALDIAALALDQLPALDDASLRAAHRRGALDPEAADRAYDLAAMAVVVREHVMVRADDSPFAARARALLGGEPAPRLDAVRVWIEGPEFVDPALWHAPGAWASAARARWLLRTLDGLAVGGGRLRVRTDRPIRAGRRGPVHEPRKERRRRLFSRWDQGIRTDDEGLISATPEALALRIATGAEGVVLDGTCGVGAMTIAFARQPGVRRVIAVDLDASRLAMARHNAALYGVADRIEWIAGDVLTLLREREADLLVLDPPWGGRDYDRERVALDDLGLDVRAALGRHRGAVVLKLPRSFDVATLPGGGWRVEPLVDEREILKMLIARRG